MAGRGVDLGAGGAYFARAAQALGATVVTVDAERSREYSGIGHVQADLNHTIDTVEKILALSGDKFDVVVEHVISHIPYQNIRRPSRDAVVTIAQKVLKRRGYLCSDLVSEPRNKIYQKK